MDNIPEIQTGINIEEIHAQTPPASLRRHGLSDSLLRIWNMVSEPRTRKNDSIDTTQDAAPHHSDEKKIQKNWKKVIEHTIEEGNDDKTENCSTDDKSGDDQSTKSEDDMDSGVTFDEDSEKDIDTAEIEEEDWFDYIRRSTADAIDKMDHAKIRCWNRTHRKMKWKLASRIATSPSERWVKKAAEWNPELSSKYRTSRMIGRPKKRWEDDINDFLKQNHDERKIDEPRERRIQNNNMWINIAIDRKEWTRLEEKYTLQNAK